MGRFLSKSSNLLIGLSLGLSGILSSAQASQNEFIWSNISGFQSAQSCEVVKQSETRFRVSKNSENSSLGYENLRALKNRSRIVALVVDGSLVKLSNDRDSGNYEAITVTGVNEAPGVDVRGHVAQRNYNGLLFEDSLRSIKDYIFQITDLPTIEGGQMEEELIPSTDVKLVDSFIQPVLDGNEFVFFRCDDKDYLAFDVHRGAQQGAVARVGVHWDATSLFRHIRTHTIAEAEQAILEQARLEADGSTIMGSIRSFFTSDENTSRARNLHVTAGATDGEEITVDLSEGEEGSEDQAEASAVNVEQNARDEEEIEAAQAAEEDERDETSVQQLVTGTNEVPVINGSLEYTVCMSAGTLNVRGLTSEGEINTSDELFQVRRYAIAKPVDNFGESEKVARVGGEDVTFVLVQFPDVAGDNIGWVAKDLVVPSSHCAGFQRAQGNDQTITCTNNGTLNVYTLNGGSLVPSNFNANQFEEIAVRTDVDAGARYRTINGQRVEYTAVVFPNRNNETGWVAKSFVKTKATCEPYKTMGSSGNSNVSGNLFPLQGRPTSSYLSAPKCFGCGRSGGRKHAATDLYRPRNERIQSIADGRVLRGMYYFYQGTYAVEVKNDDGKVVRYGETNGRSYANGRVKKGDSVGQIGKTHCCTPMLHFEMYDGRAGNASLSGGGAYRRRWDLMNPTSLVRQMERARFGASY